MENMIECPCEKCGKIRKFRLVKKTGEYKDYRPLCATCVGRSRIHPTHNYIDVIDCEEKAYAFGFFWADGCINRYKTFTVRLQTQDADVLDFFKDYFGGVRATREFKRKDGRVYQQEEWVIHDMVFVNHLKASGFREHLNAVSDHLFHHFLRGLIDGDGCYFYTNDKLSSLSISSKYEDDFEWLKTRLNVKTSVYKYIQENGNKSSALSFLGGSKVITDYKNWLYHDATVYLKRKYDKNN